MCNWMLSPTRLSQQPESDVLSQCAALSFIAQVVPFELSVRSLEA